MSRNMWLLLGGIAIVGIGYYLYCEAKKERLAGPIAKGSKAIQSALSGLYRPGGSNPTVHENVEGI